MYNDKQNTTDPMAILAMAYARQNTSHHLNDDDDCESMPDLEGLDDTHQVDSRHAVLARTKTLNQCLFGSEASSTRESTPEPYPVSYAAQPTFPVETIKEDEVPLLDMIESPDFDDKGFEAVAFAPPEHHSYRYYNWFITYFSDNWDPNFANVEHLVFACLTKEICPTTGRIHYHAYVEFDRQFSRENVQEALGCPRANCDVRKGTQRQAVMYCTKKRSRFPGFEPVIFGKLKRQGLRNDLDWYVEAIIQGATLSELLRIGGGNVARYTGMIVNVQKALSGDNIYDLRNLARRRAAKLAGTAYQDTPYPDISKETYKELANIIALNKMDTVSSSELLDRALLMVVPSSREEQLKLEKKQNAPKAVKAPKKPLQDVKVYKKVSAINAGRIADNILARADAFVYYTVPALLIYNGPEHQRHAMDLVRKYISDFVLLSFGSDPESKPSEAIIGYIDVVCDKVSDELFSRLSKSMPEGFSRQTTPSA